MSGDQELQAALEAVRATYFDAEGANCDYGALLASPEHARLRASLAALEGFDFKLVRIHAQTAFWLNAFNAGVLRDVAELARAVSLRQVETFFEKPRLRVAGFEYSLDDIQHGLLRGNVPKFKSSRVPMRPDDPRLAHTPLAYDERMHFGLYSATRSSPPLRVLDAGKVDSQLEDATEHYLRREVRIEDKGARVILPRQFYWYRRDFGDDQAALEFALARLDEAAADMVDLRRGRVKLRYADFDWTLNRKA
jgi:hypothetical protein